MTKKCLVCKSKMIHSDTNVVGVTELLICEATKDVFYKNSISDFHSHYIVSKWTTGNLRQIIHPTYLVSEMNNDELYCVNKNTNKCSTINNRKLFKAFITEEAVKNFILIS